MKNEISIEYINELNRARDYISTCDEISDEARAIIESSRLLSQGNDELFYAHIKYFTDSPVILREINRILKIKKQSHIARQD